MPTYLKSITFYNRAALAGSFDSQRDDIEVNQLLDDLRSQGAEIKDIQPTASGGFFKYTLTYVVTYEADVPVQL
jgi:hypothetical protein